MNIWRVFGVGLLALWLPQAFGAAQIVWLNTHLPPISIGQGQQRGQGMLDQLGRSLQQHLPGYEHQQRWIALANLPALLSSDTSTTYCSLMLLADEQRSQWLTFSPAYGYVLPPGLVVRSDRVGKLAAMHNAHGQVELQQVLASSDWRGVLLNRRSYGFGLTSGLQRWPIALPLRSATSIDQALRMVWVRRADFTLGYSFEPGFYHYSAEQLSYVPIAESPDLIPLRASCSKHAAGEKALRVIGAALDQDFRNRFRAIYERWLSPSVLQHYRARLGELKVEGK